MALREGLNALTLMTMLDCALYPFEQLALQLDAIQREEPELKPELDAVREHLGEAAQAIRRAGRFVHARYDVGNEAA